MAKTYKKTRSRIDRLREMNDAGVPLAEICKALNLTRTYAHELARTNGITVTSREPAKVVEIDPRKQAGTEALPAGHPLAVVFLPRLASLEGASWA